MRSNAAIRRRYSFPPLCMPNVSSISAAVRNRIVLALLRHRQGRKKDRNNTILAERYTVMRMAGDLKNEMTVSTFIEELAGRQAADGQTTQDERSRGETQILVALVAFEPDQLNSFNFPDHLLRDPNARLKLVNRAIERFEITRARTERWKM